MLETLNDDLNIIQSLSDLPNEDDDLTAQELKEKFDAAGNAIKEYINTVLVSSLNEDAAHNIGIGTIEGLEDCETIADALLYLANSIIGSITGTIPDNSISNAKLRSRGVDGTGGIQSEKIGLGAVEDINIKSKTVGADQLADEGVTTDKYANGSITTAKYADGSVTNDKLANNISGNKLESESIPAGKHAAKSVRGSDMADSFLALRHIPDGLIPYSKLDASTVQGIVRTLTVTLTSGRTAWTVSAQGVTADNLVVVGPAPASKDEYENCGVAVTAQSSNSLTFTAKSATTSTITVNVAIF